MAEARPSGTFELEDPHWLEYLKRHGYAVIKNVADTAEVEHARSLYWDYFAKLGATPEDIESWDKLPRRSHGIAFDGALAQSEGPWFIRGLPNLKRVFAKIWKTDELITSMDATILWKPWWIKSEWRPVTEGLHLDQNPFTHPELDCVQGMVPLFDVTDVTGGLEVVADSHLPAAREAFTKRNPHLAGMGQFLPLPDDDPLQGTGRLLTAQAGDLIIWDSRTVHGGVVGSGDGDPSVVRLARLAQTVCMTPWARASETVQEQRRRGFENGVCFNHCPHEANCSAQARATFTPPTLTDAQRALL